MSVSSDDGYQCLGDEPIETATWTWDDAAGTEACGARGLAGFVRTVPRAGVNNTGLISDSVNHSPNRLTTRVTSTQFQPTAPPVSNGKHISVVSTYSITQAQ